MDDITLTLRAYLAGDNSIVFSPRQVNDIINGVAQRDTRIAGLVSKLADATKKAAFDAKIMESMQHNLRGITDENARLRSALAKGGGDE
jgi:hypothetical protein